MTPNRRLPQSGRISRQVERQATEWVLRAQNGLTAREQAELATWLAEDPYYAQVHEEMKETLTLLGQLRGTGLPACPGASAQVYPSHDRSLPCSRRHTWIVSATLAAAAAVLIGLATWRMPTSVSSFAQSATTQVGGLKKWELPDGSTVHLNTNSVVEVTYSRGGRDVRLLSGEAYFAVARDVQRPFRVHAGKVFVQALGTAFNVKCRADAVEVLVDEGSVSVDLADDASGPAVGPPTGASLATRFAPHRLSAGQRALIPIPAYPQDTPLEISVTMVGRPMIASAVAWQSRRLEFSEATLEEVVAEFNRYNQQKLVIDDPALGAVTFGGAFSSNGVESLVEVLEQSFGVYVERLNDTIILRRKP